MSDNCVVCDLLVRPRQEALECDSCSRWQHRTCNSGVTRQEYRNLTRSREDFPFQCLVCRDERSISVSEDEVFRPAEVMESFDISHRRGVEEEDVEPQERTLQEEADENIEKKKTK